MWSLFFSSLTDRLGRKRGVASTPLFIIPGFFLHFSLEPSYSLKEMGKFFWEGREYGGKRNGHWIDIPIYLFPLISITEPDG